MSLADPEISRKLVKLVNTKIFYQLPEEAISRWQNAFVSAKTIADLPQDILQKIGWS